jgi:phosphoribosylanthranilate isomerase
VTGVESIKVCGVTQEREIDGLARLGVGYFGLIVGLNVDYAVTEQRASELVAHANKDLHGTIVTKEHNVDTLSRLVENTGAPAIQLAGFTSARRVAKLRQRFDSGRLKIMQVIHFQSGRAAEQENLVNYSDAGVDYFIVDNMGENGALGSTGTSIDLLALDSFRKSAPRTVPVLVAGGVNVSNVCELMAAAGAVGIDVSSSVRNDSGVDISKVVELIAVMS